MFGQNDNIFDFFVAVKLCGNRKFFNTTSKGIEGMNNMKYHHQSISTCLRQYLPD